jgi:hypothetical protein
MLGHPDLVSLEAVCEEFELTRKTSNQFLDDTLGPLSVDAGQWLRSCQYIQVLQWNLPFQ